MSERIISVLIITYNHGKFIRQCIESVLSQQTSFKFDIVAADDCSTDNTQVVLLELQSKHPETIKLILQEKNQGPARNWLNLLAYSNAPFLAYMEGDDYWVDDTKLQKQVDFLLQNPKFSMSFHDVSILQAHQQDNFRYPIPPTDTLYFTDVLRDHYIPSSSIVFRNYPWVKSLPSFFLYAVSGDIPFELMLAANGPVKYFSAKMSCYRRNLGSITQSRKNTGRLIRGYIWMYLQLSKNLPVKYSIYTSLKALRYMMSYVKYLITANKI